MVCKFFFLFHYSSTATDGLSSVVAKRSATRSTREVMVCHMSLIASRVTFAVIAGYFVQGCVFFFFQKVMLLIVWLCGNSFVFVCFRLLLLL